MVITLIISSSYGIPLAKTNVNITTKDNDNTNNDNDNEKSSSSTCDTSDICKKVSAIGRLMNNNDNDIFEISIGNNIILCRSLTLLSDSNDTNDTNDTNNTTIDDVIYIIFCFSNASNSTSNSSNNNSNDNNNMTNNNSSTILSSLKLYSLYIGYIVIMILNDDIKKYYKKIQQNINNNINNSTFHSIVCNDDNNKYNVNDNDDNDNTTDIFINLEDHFLCKVLYILLNDNDDDNNNNNNTINWLSPMCKSVPEVSAVDTAYIYSINKINKKHFKLKQEYYHHFGNDTSDIKLDENWELALMSYYHYCINNIDNPNNITDMNEGIVISINDENGLSKHYCPPRSHNVSLLTSLILTDTNAKLLLVLKVPQYLLKVDPNNMQYSDYFTLSSVNILPIQLLQCWKECLFRVKKAFISKQSIYYIARTINNSIETYDTILKNCTSVVDFHKLIPLPPKNISAPASSSIKRPGRKIV